MLNVERGRDGELAFLPNGSAENCNSSVLLGTTTQTLTPGLARCGSGSFNATQDSGAVPVTRERSQIPRPLDHREDKP